MHCYLRHIFMQEKRQLLCAYLIWVTSFLDFWEQIITGNWDNSSAVNTDLTLTIKIKSIIVEAPLQYWIKDNFIEYYTEINECEIASFKCSFFLYFAAVYSCSAMCLMLLTYWLRIQPLNRTFPIPFGHKQIMNNCILKIKK